MCVIQTDPIFVPQHVTAGAVLLRLASGVFAQAKVMEDDQGGSRLIALGVWLVLRTTAELFLHRRSLELTEGEYSALKDALLFCPACTDLEFVYALPIETRVAA